MYSHRYYFPCMHRDLAPNDLPANVDFIATCTGSSISIGSVLPESCTPLCANMPLPMREAWKAVREMLSYASEIKNGQLEELKQPHSKIYTKDFSEKELRDLEFFSEGKKLSEPIISQENTTQRKLFAQQLLLLAVYFEERLLETKGLIEKYNQASLKLFENLHPEKNEDTTDFEVLHNAISKEAGIVPDNCSFSWENLLEALALLLPKNTELYTEDKKILEVLTANNIPILPDERCSINGKIYQPLWKILGKKKDEKNFFYNQLFITLVFPYETTPF